MASTLIVKITDGDSIRRFTVRASDLKMTAIQKRIGDAFGVATFKLLYKDDEGDDITIDTEEELAEAVGLALSVEPSILRLKLKLSPRTATASTATAPPPPTANPPGGLDLSHLMGNIAKELPDLVKQLPQAVQRMIPSAELDVGATLAATAAAAANAKPRQKSGIEFVGIHPGVTCDRTNVGPIEGTRYNLIGHDYDLCESEYLKLSEEERALYKAIPPPCWRPMRPGAGKDADGEAPNGFHPGVSCDKSGQRPIIGWRYHLCGHNYDLCQAEFDKLPADERQNFQRIAPPRCAPPSARPFSAGGHGGGWRCGTGRSGRFEGPQKLSARFISDVSIHDGTEMAPGTRFTKIWRLKNVGEVAWPAGTRLLFVGGDSMSAEDTVALPVSEGVRPSEELDIAVDMVAPAEHGRHVGYWRLVVPTGRKFGQRIWCHIQCVDASAPVAAPSEVEMKMAAAQARGEVTDTDMETDVAEVPSASAAKGIAEGVAAAAEGAVAAMLDTAEMLEKTSLNEPDELAAASPEAVKAVAAEPEPAKQPASPASLAASDNEDVEMVGSTTNEEGVAAELRAMGFSDGELVHALVLKHGPNLDRCLDALAALSEVETTLDDLAEMGFTDRPRNKLLLVRYGGCIKKAIKTLVSGSDDSTSA